MRIENLTPHAIALRREDGSTLILDGRRDAARILTEPGNRLEDAQGVAVYASPRFVRVEHLPAPRDGILLVVSQLTALAVAAFEPERDDVVYPGTGMAEGATRDATGVVTVQRLIRAA